VDYDDSMAGITRYEAAFIGICLEGLLYGFYSALFVMYLQYQASNKDTDRRTTIIFYCLCVLYAFSTIMLAMDIGKFIVATRGIDITLLYRFVVTSSVLSGCCDFIAQSILIYRCWIVWNRSILVILVPSILAITFLALWIPGSVLLYPPVPGWVYPMTITSFAMSLTVNALVTGLIVFRITKVYWQVVKPAVAGKTFGATGGSRLRPVIFILIESGMALLCMQLAQMVLNVVQTKTAIIVDQPVAYIVQMLNGITPTIIQVRVSMGLSFDDQESMMEATRSTLQASNHMRFGSGSDHPVSIPGSVTIVGQESRDDIGLLEMSNDLDNVKN